MRVLLSNKSRKELFSYLKEKHDCSSIRTLSKYVNVSKNTLQCWSHDPNRYIPFDFIPKEFLTKIKILDEKEKNWGQRIGGKKTFKIILEKYGLKEIRRRQSLGGKVAMKKIRDSTHKSKLEIDLKDNYFLEFYGALLGDGWIGKYIYKNKVKYLVGLSGHAKLDRNYHLYMKNVILSLFNRKAYLKEKPKYNAIELNFSHKELVNFLNVQLGFPIGKKKNLEISEKVFSLEPNKFKWVVRGIFDTDGSFYFDKDPLGRPYPCISIEMKSSKLIKQIFDFLICQEFKVTYKVGKRDRLGKDRITLKGRKQLNKWMDEIGSSNSKHLDKIKGLVTQSG